MIYLYTHKWPIYTIYIYIQYIQTRTEREGESVGFPASYARLLQDTCEPPTKMLCKRLSQDTAKTRMYTFDTASFSRCSISIIVSHLWYPKIVNYHGLTLQMRLLDPLLIYLTTWDTLSPDCSLEKGSLFRTRSCFHKGSAHSPQGQRSIETRSFLDDRSNDFSIGEQVKAPKQNCQSFVEVCWSLKFDVYLIFDKQLTQIEHVDGTRFVDVFFQGKINSHSASCCLYVWFFILGSQLHSIPPPKGRLVQEVCVNIIVYNNKHPFIHIYIYISMHVNLPIHGTRAPSILQKVCIPWLCFLCFGVVMLSSFANLPMALTTPENLLVSDMSSVTVDGCWHPHWHSNPVQPEWEILADAVGGIFLNFKMGMSQNFGGLFVHLAGTWRFWMNPVWRYVCVDSCHVFIFTLSNSFFLQVRWFCRLVGNSELEFLVLHCHQTSCDPSFWANFFLTHQRNRSAWLFKKGTAWRGSSSSSTDVMAILPSQVRVQRLLSPEKFQWKLGLLCNAWMFHT